MLEQWIWSWKNLTVFLSADSSKDVIGRGKPIKWIKVPLGDNRSGPLNKAAIDINLGTDISKAGRAAETMRRVVQKAVEDRHNHRWLQAILSLISSKHATVTELAEVIGATPFSNLTSQLADVVEWMQYRFQEMPTNISSRVSAIARKVNCARKDDRNRAQGDWLNSLFEHGSS